MRSRVPLIAVDAHHVGRRATGNETYVRGLLEGLRDVMTVDILALADAGADFPDGVATRALASRNPVARLTGQLARPRRNWGADLLHVQYVRPPRCDVPVVTTIHDISYEHHPETFTRRTRARMRLTIPWSARHSAAVITGSQYSRDDLVATYGLQEGSVHVTPYAAAARFRRLGQQEARDGLTGLDVPPDFILSVGNLQPRKNLPRLLEAFAELRAAGHDVPLVLVGQPAWLYSEIFDVVRRRGLSGVVHFTGFVTDDQLVSLYNLAGVFVYPSLFEGFGLPVLEALACGSPTLTSATTSIPEVAGNAALLVDPTRVDEIAGGLQRLLADGDLRRQLRDAGPVQAARFSWQRCAEQTAAVYNVVARRA